MINNAMQALHDPRLLKAAAAKLASMGSHGDSMLIHVNPREAAMLKACGGIGSINPRTGLHQFYDGDGSAGNGTTNGNGNDGNNGSGAATGGTGGTEAGFDDQQSGISNNATPGPANAPGYDPAVDPNAHGIMNSIAGFFGQQSPPESATMGLKDAPDQYGYSGLATSNAALSAAGMVGGLVGGPPGAAVTSGLAAAAQGRGLGGSIGAAAGGAIGIGAAPGSTIGSNIESALSSGPSTSSPSGPASAPNSSTSGDATAAMIAAMGPTGQDIAGDPTRMLALLRASSLAPQAQA